MMEFISVTYLVCTLPALSLKIQGNQIIKMVTQTKWKLAAKLLRVGVLSLSFHIGENKDWNGFL